MFLASSNVVREFMCSELHSRIFISLAGAYFFLMTRSLCTISLIYFSVFEYCCVLIELKFHLLSPVLTDNKLLYNKKRSSLGNTLLRACSTNQVITVWENRFCQMDSVAPVLEVAFWVNVSCICVGQACKPYLNSSSFLPCSLCLSLSLTHSLIHTNTHAVHASALSHSDPLGESWLTPDELAMGKTSPWPHCSPTQPMPTVPKNTLPSLDK